MLFLVHHADAVAPDVDSQRPLSVAGRMHADSLAQRARDRGVAPGVIWHSGKLRARQTAEAFWRACNPLAQFAAIRGLQPTDPPEWIRDVLTDEARDVMLVGHMPSLPRIVALLTGNPRGEFPLHGLIALELDSGAWIEKYRL
jgi:phosphohistidine phosphatase